MSTSDFPRARARARGLIIYFFNFILFLSFYIYKNMIFLFFIFRNIQKKYTMNELKYMHCIRKVI